MTKALHIGKSNGRPFTLPPDVVTNTTACLGIRGSGKTNTGGVVVEELLAAGHQAVIIDPTDVWWGLRTSADGKRDGFKVVILGGAHGDIPLNADDGRVVADFVVEQRASAVLSLRHLRKGDQRRFVTDFAEQLYHRKGESGHRTPVLVVIDECDAFIPQRVGGAEARMVGAIEDLVRRGRAAGLGVFLISQRAASVNKDVLTQIELLIAHRHTSPQDRAALKLWIEAHDTEDRQAEFMDSIAGLKRGRAWLWSPGWLDVFEPVDVRLRSTFDSSRTPEGGERVASPKALAAVDLDALRDKLAATIEQARANDPKALRARIAELEARKPAAVADDRAVARAVAERDAFWRKRETELIQTMQRHVGIAGRVRDGLGRIAADLGAIHLNGEAKPAAPPVAVSRRTLQPEASPPRDLNHAHKAVVVNRSRTEAGGTADVGRGGLRRILTALAQRRQGLTSRQMGIRAGLSAKGGSFRTYCSAARTSGWIESVGGVTRITAAGLAALGDFEPLPTGPALLEYWLVELGNSGAAKILRALADAWPSRMSRADVEAATGLSAAGGSFRTYVSRLRTLQLIEGSSELKAADELFDAAVV